MESLIINHMVSFFFPSKSMQSKEITPQHVITFRWGRILLDRLIPSTQGYSLSLAREWWVTGGVCDIKNYLPKISKKIDGLLLLKIKSSNTTNLVRKFF